VPETASADSQVFASNHALLLFQLVELTAPRPTSPPNTYPTRLLPTQSPPGDLPNIYPNPAWLWAAWTAALVNLNTISHQLAEHTT
jgi:hypothetical protein